MYHDRALTMSRLTRFAITCLATIVTIIQAQNESTVVIPYNYLDSQAISGLMNELPNKYPNFVEINTSQSLYGLPSAGTDQDCSFDDSQMGCVNWIITIYDRTKHSVSEQSFKELPTVLLSGALHGDERVGPTAVMEVALLLLEAAQCESHILRNRNKHDSCRKELEMKGVPNDRTRQWLARLVATRRIIIIPSANSLGYYRNEREEAGIDPNRDFPFDLLDSTQCMQTIAGRTINEVFRDHLIQLSFTFHGGMEAIGYEWGAPSYLNQPSPDEVAQVALASRYSWYGGVVEGRTYPFGDMNNLVYPVRGGMEDWAYAASWDKTHTEPCTPSTFDGYPTDRTIYEDGTLRAFNMLVETSNWKQPPIETLGSNQDLFSPDGGGNGHISRNMRLSLLALDAVQPYVTLTSVNGVDTMDFNAMPLLQITPENCSTVAASVQVPNPEATVVVEWTVGGAFDVDETYLVYGKQEDVDASILYCTTQPDPQRLDAWIQGIIDANEITDSKKTNSGTSVQFTAFQNGRTRWHQEGPSPMGQQEQPLGMLPLDPVFNASINLSSFQPGDAIVIFAIATVDSLWNSSNAQSHMVNARTNNSWRFTNVAEMVIQGHVRWMSSPTTVMVAGPEKAKEKQQTSTTTSTSTEARKAAPHLISIILLALISLIICAAILVMKRRLFLTRSRQSKGAGGSSVKYRKGNNVAELETVPLGREDSFVDRSPMARFK